MKYAILSDIHSKPDALERALEDAWDHDVYKVICLGEFAGYAGRVVEAVLKDEIDYRIVKEQGATGSVRIYPGQKLFVKKVPSHGEKVVCVTKDEKLLADVIRDEKDYGLPVEFTIPRRDFELGYFRVFPETMKLQDTFAAAPADESETIDDGDGLGE